MSLATTQLVTGYFLLGIVALAGAVVADLLPKGEDEDLFDRMSLGRHMLNYFAAAILPTLLVYVARDIFTDRFPFSLYLLLVFILGLVGNDLTRKFMSLRYVFKFIRSGLEYVRGNPDEFDEFCEDIINDEEETKEIKPTEESSDDLITEDDVLDGILMKEDNPA